MNGPLFPGGQSYEDFVANEGRVRDHRGNPGINAGRRATQPSGYPSRRLSTMPPVVSRQSFGDRHGLMMASTALGGMVGGMLSGDKIERIAQVAESGRLPGAAMGAAIGAAAAYGMNKKSK